MSDQKTSSAKSSPSTARAHSGQIHAPGFPKFSDEERRRLDVWSEHDGWCSACKREDATVVHIGSVAKCVNVALCSECLRRMIGCLP